MEIREIKLDNIHFYADFFFEKIKPAPEEKRDSLFHIIFDYKCTKSQLLWMTYWCEEFCHVIKRLSPNYNITLSYISPNSDFSTIYEETKDWSLDEVRDKLKGRSSTEARKDSVKNFFEDKFSAILDLVRLDRRNIIVILTAGENKPMSDTLHNCRQKNTEIVFVLFNNQVELLAKFQEDLDCDKSEAVPIRDISWVRPFFEYGRGSIPGILNPFYIGSHSIIFHCDEHVLFPLEFIYHADGEEDNRITMQIDTCARFIVEDLTPNTRYIFKYRYGSKSKYKIIYRATQKEKKNNHIVKNGNLAKEKIEEAIKKKFDSTSVEPILRECDLKKMNVNLYGMKGAGKSNTICTLASICQGKFDDRLAPFANSTNSFTRKLQSHKIPILSQLINFYDIFGIEIHKNASEQGLLDFEQGETPKQEDYHRIPQLLRKGSIKEGFLLEDIKRLEEIFKNEKDKDDKDSFSKRTHGLIIVVDSRDINFPDKLHILNQNIKFFDNIPYVIFFTHLDKLLEKESLPYKSEDLYQNPVILHSIKYLSDKLSENLKLDISPERIFPVVNYTVPYDERDFSREFPFIDGIQCLIQQVKNHLRASNFRIKVILEDKDEKKVILERVFTSLDISLDAFKKSVRLTMDKLQVNFIHLRDNNRIISITEDKQLTLDDISLPETDKELTYYIVTHPI